MLYIYYIYHTACGTVRSYYSNVFCKNFRPATMVFTCKFRDIFCIYTVIFQHFFQSLNINPIKLIVDLNILYPFFFSKTEAVGPRCSTTFLKKDSSEGVFSVK